MVICKEEYSIIQTKNNSWKVVRKTRKYKYVYLHKILRYFKTKEKAYNWLFKRQKIYKGKWYIGGMIK